MTCEYTWPNHLLGSDSAAVSALLEQHGLQGDVAFGHTKLFIRSPRTLVTLEQSRARLIPIIVLLLQKVERAGLGLAGAAVGWGVCGRDQEGRVPLRGVACGRGPRGGAGGGCGLCGRG